jgi:glutathione S-transferase
LAITFYYGAGSPYTWRVWFALEHKNIPYDIKLMSFSEGDLKKPEFRAINPRGKVPTIVDNGFVLSESAAILEYLEQSRPDSGKPLFPGNAQDQAIVRRMVCEADNYYAPSMNKLVTGVLFTKPEDWDEERIAAAREQCVSELGRVAAAMRGDFLAGPLSAADFALYPMLAICLRCDVKKPDLGLGAALPPKIGAWVARMEALPYYAKTRPAHWN